jgi:chromate reductase, NAD(P)H dehydrogenase (quinone)
VQVLGVSGSLREGSHNKQLLEAASGELPPGVTLDLFEGLEEVPAFNEDLERDPPHGAQQFLDAVSHADALLFATPEYNSSVPGALKNAVDWASRPFPDNALHDKPAAVVGASTGLFGAVWAQAELRKILAAAGAKVLDEELPVGHAAEAFDDEGGLASPDAAQRLRDILAALVAQAEQLQLAAEEAGRHSGASSGRH